MNNFKLPYVLPFKFVKKKMTGMHFGDKWHCMQIRSFEMRATYKQKWVKSKITKLQCESTVVPSDLVLLNRYGTPVKMFEWEEVFDGTSYKIYETTFDVSDMDDDTYYLYQLVAVSESIVWEYLTEPIAVAVSHVNVININYSNSFNKDDMAWTTGIDMTMMIEGDIQDYEPDSDETDYVSENKDTKTLDVIPGSTFQLYIGDTRDSRSGVAPYMIDILNRVFACDRISIGTPGVDDLKRYDNKTGSKFKITRVRGYPLIGASIEIVPSFNEQSLEDADTTPFASGIVTAYNIETDFFGEKGTVPVINIEENG